MKNKGPRRWKTWILGFTLVILAMGSILSGVGITGEYQFSQLDPFFENDLFGLIFDYNPNVPKDQNLCLKTDLINQIQYENEDPDLQEDNIISLVGHDSQEIKSAFLALQQVKRTQDIIIDTIEWQTIVPFAKYLHQFTLPTGEEVILGQDFLGMALKLNGSGFNPAHYQLGYANVPLDFLEFIIPESGDASFNLSVDTSIIIQETANELQIHLIYSNVTFLFQTANINLENLFQLEIAEHLLIVQFDRIEFSNIFRKYSHHGISGVETLSEIRIGNALNLIINEELPQDQNWLNAFDYEIQEDFKDLIPIQETFSVYQGLDIKNRLQKFSDISFSIITAQNIGVLNGTQAVDNFKVLIDDQNRTSREIERNNYPVLEEISVLHDKQLLFSTQVKGRNFAQRDNLSLIPVETQVIALDQQSGFAETLLFQQETSLLKELVAECIKRFINDPMLSALGTNEIIHKGGLDLSSALYYQDFQLKGWTGLGFKINLIQYAIKTGLSSSFNSKSSQITLSPTVLELLGPLILGVVIIRRIRIKRKPKTL